MNRSNVRVDTHGFQAAHGRAPRGRGTWAFGPDRNTDACSDAMFWFNGSFAEARAAAVAHFAARGVSTVHVQS
jgi:hypothetical protein